MTIKEALHRTAQRLASHAIEDASLEAELLTMHLLGVDRARLYSRLGDELSHDEVKALDKLLERRLCHEPIAYILGQREFFGHDFYVAPGVFIPRPESELLVEQALEFFGLSDKPPTLEKVEVIAEIGTGSGAIAISLALSLPQAKIYATDVSTHALEIARMNCARHGVRIHLLEGDLLAPLPEPVDMLISNLPYVKNAELTHLAVEIRGFEPLSALAGGEDGLDKVRQLLAEAGDKLRPGGLILLEIGAGQGQTAASLARGVLPEAEVELVKDLGGIERVLRVNLPRFG